MRGRVAVWMSLFLFAISIRAVAQGRTVVMGRVLDSSGARLAAVSVRLLDTVGVTLATTATDKGGSFTFMDVSPGSYGLVAEHREERSSVVLVQIDHVLPLDIAPNHACPLGHGGCAGRI